LNKKIENKDKIITLLKYDEKLESFYFEKINDLAKNIKIKYKNISDIIILLKNTLKYPFNIDSASDDLINKLITKQIIFFIFTNKFYEDFNNIDYKIGKNLSLQKEKINSNIKGSQRDLLVFKVKNIIKI